MHKCHISAGSLSCFSVVNASSNPVSILSAFELHNKMSINKVSNIVLLIIFCLCPLISPSNILVVSPFVSKSHFNVGEAFAVGLAEAGHNVTIVTAFDYKPKRSNIEQVQITGAIEMYEGPLFSTSSFSWYSSSFHINSMFHSEERMKGISVGLDDFQNMHISLLLPLIFSMGGDLTNFTLLHRNIKAMFGRKYDLVIVEIFGCESLIGLGQQLDAPVIGYSTFGTSRWTNDLIGNPSPLSYVAHPMLDFPDQMNFWHRIYNAVFYAYESAILTFMHHPAQRSIYNQAFPDAKISYDEARKNVALIFVNSHFSLARPLPYLPNTIEVGGMHVNRKVKPLPKEITEFIESATDGVVYFSLGSFIKSADFPVEKRDVFINAFAKIKQKVIWKFEDKTVSMPKNVYTSSWLPQNDILGHPNVKAFISHGGLLGSTEAVYHGVPIIGIPFFGDQRLNVKRASQAGWAITLDYANITAISVEWALNEILNNKKYFANVKIISERYRDQPMTPSETMVYWSEYVIRHKGAPHLRSAGLDLNYFQYHNLDVLLFLAAFICVIIYATKWSISKLCCRRSKVVEKSNKKEN